jgi:hypothetical protein
MISLVRVGMAGQSNPPVAIILVIEFLIHGLSLWPETSGLNHQIRTDDKHDPSNIMSKGKPMKRKSC